MGLRKGHGNGAGVPRIEVSPADELSNGVQAPEQAESGGERRVNGTFAKGARTTQSKGGKSRRNTVGLAHKLGLGDVTASPEFRPYLEQAKAFRLAHCRSLAASVGGGHCGPGPSSIVASAALQLAASRYLFDQASTSGEASTFASASRLADASRQNLLAAHEICAKEALARPKANQVAALAERLGIK